MIMSRLKRVSHYSGANGYELILVQLGMLVNAYSELVSFLKEACIGVHMYDSFQVSSQRVTSIHPVA